MNRNSQIRKDQILTKWKEKDNSLKKSEECNN